MFDLDAIPMQSILNSPTSEATEGQPSTIDNSTALLETMLESTSTSRSEKHTQPTLAKTGSVADTSNEKSNIAPDDTELNPDDECKDEDSTNTTLSSKVDSSTTISVVQQNYNHRIPDSFWIKYINKKLNKVEKKRHLNMDDIKDELNQKYGLTLEKKKVSMRFKLILKKYINSRLVVNGKLKLPTSAHLAEYKRQCAFNEKFKPKAYKQTSARGSSSTAEKADNKRPNQNSDKSKPSKRQNTQEHYVYDSYISYLSLRKGIVSARAYVFLVFQNESNLHKNFQVSSNGTQNIYSSLLRYLKCDEGKDSFDKFKNSRNLVHINDHRDQLYVEMSNAIKDLARKNDEFILTDKIIWNTAKSIDEENKKRKKGPNGGFRPFRDSDKEDIIFNSKLVIESDIIEKYMNTNVTEE